MRHGFYARIEEEVLSGSSAIQKLGPAFQNLVFLEKAEPITPTLKIQSLNHQPSDTFLERETCSLQCLVLVNRPLA